MASQQLIDIIIKAQDQASATANKVDQSLKKIGDTGGLLGRIPGFNTLSQKLSGIGSTIKSKVSPYVDSARSKLQNLSNGAKGFGAVLGPLKGALGMTAGMIGYDLVNGLVQAARASINANSQLDYFGQRLNMTASETTKFRSEIEGLQKEFRKVDMTAVGATAEEMAVKFNLPKKSISDLTRMTAVMSSTFVKEGRSQEDAILAVGDALDGQFKRLQEIGITQQSLIDNGWTGNIEDQDSLIQALNKTMKDMGYEQTAKDITNLDEAWQALTIAGGQLLQKILVPITPIIIRMVDAFLKVADAVGPIISKFVEFVSKMPDWAKFTGLAIGFAIAVTQIASWISLTLIPALAGAALAALDFAAALLMNPLTWVAIALAAVAYAIYEIGKAFGWWTDVNSMLSAIWAGIQRLWSAFINHPDVQGLINGIKWAWNALQPVISGVVNWVMSFFNNANAKGKFDIVRALIKVLGAAWQSITLPIRLVITVVKLLWNAVKTAGNNIRNTINNIRAWFAALPGHIRSAISTLVSIIIAPFKNAYSGVTKAVDDIKSYVGGIPGAVSGALSGLASTITKPFSDAYSRIVKVVDDIKAKAKQIPVIGGAFGFDLEGIMEELQGKPLTKEELIKLEHEIDFNFDFNNLPTNIDEATLTY